MSVENVYTDIPADDYGGFRDHSPSPGTPGRSGSNVNIKRSGSNLQPISEEASSNGGVKVKEKQKEKRPPQRDQETPPPQRGKFYI